jgi:hypothetical protein
VVRVTRESGSANRSTGADSAAPTPWSGPRCAARSGPRTRVEEGTTYSCNATAILVHPPEDEADYSITVAYPGHDGTKTATFKSVCTIDDQTAECEDAAQVLTGHGDR